MVKDRFLVYFKRAFRYSQYKIANDSFDAMMVLIHFIYNTYLVSGREVAQVKGVGKIVTGATLWL
jgi:hypothetical protein